jgi:F-type H+-transporting ATPase subunit epsilon
VALEKKTFSLKIISPYKKFYEGPAVSLSALNKQGPFDILAEHANIFSLLLPCTVRFDTGAQISEIPLNTGILRVANNKATLFINI